MKTINQRFRGYYMTASCRGTLRRYFLTAVLLGIGLWASPTAFSQDVADGQATANVLTGLSVTAVQDLQFGNVFQGIAKIMGKNQDDSSGIFSIIGAPSAGISIYLTMPDYLALPDGSDRLVVTFNNTDANVDTTVVTPSTFAGADGWINQDPRNLPAATKIGTGGQTRIYLGGKVSPAVNQKAGPYAGDIVCSVAYTGT
ncbi:MAG TPA: hypothetical protein VMS71_04215 [Candidatus Acidoferrum sp.]|nr:hypothetical protein [Candidatus Acidoferrum sp.]